MKQDITEIRDFRNVITISIDGQKPLIVGGHSVNTWATYYHVRLSMELAEFFPFTTKDLDIYGNVQLLDILHKRFGGSTPKLEPRVPVAGSMTVILDGKERIVEVLRSVNGLDHRDLQATQEVSIDGIVVNVLLPVKILKAKIANVATIDQKDRNDVKHIKMMIPCLRAFICDAAEVISNNSRPLINCLGEVQTILNAPQTLDVALKWGIDFTAIWPMEKLRAINHPGVKNFLKYQLHDAEAIDGQSEEQGTRVRP